MPYQSPHASEIARLIAERGRVAADRAMQRGQMWGGAVKSLASLLPQIQADKAADRQAQRVEEERRARMETDALQRRNYQGQIDERQRAAEEERTAREMAAKTIKVQEWLTDIASNEDPELQKAAYGAGRPELIKSGILDPSDAPEFFPGKSWVRAKMAQVLPAAERFKLLFPEPPKPNLHNVSPGQSVIDANNPTGAPIYTAPPTPPAPRAPVSVSPGARLIDPATGRVIAEGAPPREPQGQNENVGWTLQTVTDPNTNATKMVRVNSRTGEVQPVELPAGTQPGGQRTPRLTAGQQDDLATMQTVVDLANEAVKIGDEIGWKGVGGMGAGSAAAFAAKNFGMGNEKEENLRNYIGNIQGTVAKLRGGTAFSAAEKAMLDSYTPGINDSDMVIKSKVNSLIKFIDLKRKNTLQFAGGDPKIGDTTQTTKGGSQQIGRFTVEVGD